MKCFCGKDAIITVHLNNGDQLFINGILEWTAPCCEMGVCYLHRHVLQGPFREPDFRLIEFKRAKTD